MRLTNTIKIAHMEGEEIFGFCKWNANLTPKLEGDSHRHNNVSFSHLCVNHTITKLGVKMSSLRWIKFR